MNKWIITATILCVLSLIPGCQAISQDSVKLEYNYVPGEILRYKMVIDAKLQVNASQAGIIDVPMRMAGVLKQRTKRVLPNGDAEIVVAFESMRMQVRDQSLNMPVKDLPVMTYTVTKSGRIRNICGIGMDYQGPFSEQMFFAGGFGHYVILPEAELREGDTWTQDITNIPGMGRIRSSGKLTSINMRLGKHNVATFKQSVGGDLAAEMPLSISAKGDNRTPGMKMRGAFLGDGTVYFSAEEGRLIRTDGRLDMQVNVIASEVMQGASSQNASATMHIAYEMFLLTSNKSE